MWKVLRSLLTCAKLARSNRQVTSKPTFRAAASRASAQSTSKHVPQQSWHRAFIYTCGQPCVASWSRVVEVIFRSFFEISQSSLSCMPWMVTWNLISFNETRISVISVTHRYAGCRSALWSLGSTQEIPGQILHFSLFFRSHCHSDFAAVVERSELILFASFRPHWIV